MKKFIVILGLMSIVNVSLYSQVVDKDSPLPVVNQNNSVTFRLYAPNAEEVFIKGSFLEMKFQVRTKAGTFGKTPKARMIKQGSQWVYTSGPLDSEIYTYKFVVDDEEVNDPQNMNIVRLSGNFPYTPPSTLRTLSCHLRALNPLDSPKMLKPTLIPLRTLWTMNFFQ